MSAEAVPVRDPARSLWVVAGVCWAVTAGLVVLGGDRYASHDQIIDHSPLPWPARIVLFLLAWTVMVGAMMLPTTVQMARLVAAVSARAPNPRSVRVPLAVSYLTVWVGFGTVALVGDTGIHATVDHWPWLDRHSALITAGLLGLAGAVQFSTLKERCLTACRDPMSMLWRHYGREARQAWRLGWTHAVNCLGCCWALMLVVFGIGVGSLAGMLALTAVMVAEKTTRWGARLATPVGAMLLLAAAAIGLAAVGITPLPPGLPGGFD